MRFSIFAAIVASALVPAAASADRGYDVCAAKAKTNDDYTNCASAWVAREDRRLNSAWKSVYPRLPVKSKRDLLAEQRLWLSFKERSCLWRANGDWGREGQVIAHPVCRARIIAERANYLEAVAHDTAPR